ncbi:hypothetical protein RMCBS344292_14579 [Rhizopus microsporus]|nr:hypothetical protein RMCBS344292_14579 [Rhizopus microsporus]
MCIVPNTIAVGPDVFVLFFISFEVAHRGTTTDNTNELTTGQIQVLLNFSKRPKEQGIRDGSIGAKSSQKRFLTIWKPLPKNALKAAYKYEEGKWMQPGTIKRVYLPELKKYQLDVGQTIVSIAKGADRPAYSRLANNRDLSRIPGGTVSSWLKELALEIQAIVAQYNLQVQ